ncbi:MAG: hypothetical protein QGH13_04170, partial [Candidatus Thalassarchaeaceae archaeon]|nr:hypothetical protein [Candidatus Thalassarchaeaceae archaeon]
MALSGSDSAKNMGVQNPTEQLEIHLENGFELLVPAKIIDGLNDKIKNDPERLTGHLMRAIKIGLLAIEGGEFTLSTDRIESAINSSSTSMIEKYRKFDESFTNELGLLINQKLTGNESELAHRLSSAFGERGELKNRLDDIFDDISNPQKNTSVPNRVSEVMQAKFDDIELEITSALDLAKEDSPLRMFLTTQQNTINALKNDIDRQMNEIRTALKVDELLQKEGEEKEALYQQSTQKGHHFENDAVDSLQDIAGLFGDRIEHTGGEGVGKSRSKIGDIVIVIISPGIPEIRVAIEAKAGSSI